MVEVPLVGESLQDLGQNQVTDGQRLITQQAIEFLGLRCDRTVEIVDPHAESTRINYRSASSRDRPASAACAETADLRLSAEAQHNPQTLFHGLALVLRPVARSVSRISLSSITIFVRMMCILLNNYNIPGDRQEVG